MSEKGSGVRVTALCKSGQRGTVVVFKSGGFRIARVIMTGMHSKPLGFRGKVQQKRNGLIKKPIAMTNPISNNC